MYICTQEHIHNKTPSSDNEKTDMYGTKTIASAMNQTGIEIEEQVSPLFQFLSNSLLK